MSTSVSTAFVKQYIADVHMAYQQKGSKLRNCVRLQTGVVGSTADFQKSGVGMAGRKTRHGNVPVMNASHSVVTATLEDWYAPDYVDKLDENKMTINERQVIVDNGAYALGRKIDNLIITVLDSGSGTQDTASTLGLSKARILTAYKTLNAADVPDDGGRFFLVGAHQWNELMNIAEFKSSDYAGEMYPWLKGGDSRSWLGFTWIRHNGLPNASNVTKCFAFHRSAVGLAEAQDIVTHIDWVPEKAAHLIDSMITAGAVAIDSNGIYELSCDDLEAIS